MTTPDLTNRPTHKYAKHWSHFQCPTCGRLFTLPFNPEGDRALPFCVHHDSTVCWHPPDAEETDWTECVLLTPGGPAPRYEHDCDNCTFLGCLLDLDIYVCAQGTMPTLIGRASGDGPDYQSGEDIFFTKLMLPLLKLTGPRRDLKTLLQAIEEGL